MYGEEGSLSDRRQPLLVLFRAPTFLLPLLAHAATGLTYDRFTDKAVFLTIDRVERTACWIGGAT